MPVPVQIRTPRWYRVDVFETPANCLWCNWLGEKQSERLAHLQLSSPECFWRIIDQTAREVALHAANHVVVFRVPSLAPGTVGRV